MKKFLSAMFLAAALGMIFSSCSSKNDSKESHVETTSQPFTEREVEAADGTYIYDKANILDAETVKACNDYAGWLYKEKLINTAVITVNDLEGKAPYDYAADEFNKLYEGKGSGLVILINNDTNYDSVFRSGACLYGISDKAEQNAVYWETKEVFKGDYRSGIMRLLQLGELCPTHVVDNAQVFDTDQLSKIEKSLNSCKEDVTLIASHNGSDTPNEQIIKQYYERKYKNDKGIMFMLDTISGKIIAHSSESIPSDIEKALKDANTLSSKGDNYGAVNKIIEVLKKT